MKEIEQIKSEKKLPIFIREAEVIMHDRSLFPPCDQKSTGYATTEMNRKKLYKPISIR